MRSHLIETLGGRIFIHELGEGASLVVMETGGENVSVLLDPDAGAEMGAALLDVVMRAPAPPAVVVEAPILAAVKAPPKPAKRKPAKRKPRPRGGADADRLVELGYMEIGSRGRLRYTDHFVNKVAELYLAGRNDYRGKGGVGRRGYVVDQLHVDDQLDAPVASVRRALDLARKRGLIPPGLVPPGERGNGQTSNGDVDPAEGAERVRQLLNMPSA